MTETIQTAMDRLMTISAEPQELHCGRWAAVLRQLQNSQGSVLSERHKTVWA